MASSSVAILDDEETPHRRNSADWHTGCTCTELFHWRSLAWERPGGFLNQKRPRAPGLARDDRGDGQPSKGVLNRFEPQGAAEDWRAGLARKQRTEAEEAATMAINVQGLQGHWNQLKGEVKKRWGQLSDDDLKWSGGNIDQLVGRIQQRTGETRESIEKYLDQLTSQGSSAVSNAVESVAPTPKRSRTGCEITTETFPNRLAKASSSARDVVGRNPVPWIGLAFGIGVLAGVLMGGSLGRFIVAPPPILQLSGRVAAW